MWSRKREPASTARDVLVLAVEGMHCGSCGLTIDDAVEDIPGVARATTSFKTGLTEVVLSDDADPAHVGPAAVAAVASAGYGVTLRGSAP